MGMILRIASSRIVGQGDIVGRSGYFSLNLSANSVMRGRLDARRTLKSLVADLRLKKNCVDKGIPVIIGEYCADSRNRTKEVIRLFCVSVTEAIYSRGMCPMLWDTPGGQYNRQTCQFDDPLFLEEMMAIPVKYPRN